MTKKHLLWAIIPAIGVMAVVAVIDMMIMMMPATIAHSNLVTEFETLQENYLLLAKEYCEGLHTDKEYFSKVTDMKAQQDDIFDKVGSIQWEETHRSEYNYWHRSIMKFPSAVDQGKGALPEC